MSERERVCLTCGTTCYVDTDKPFVSCGECTVKKFRTGAVWPEGSGRDQFELAATEYFGRELHVIQASRMVNGSYSEPKLAAAWYFWRRGEA